MAKEEIERLEREIKELNQQIEEMIIDLHGLHGSSPLSDIEDVANDPQLVALDDERRKKLDRLKKLKDEIS